jgi:transcription antitermination factor NusG
MMFAPAKSFLNQSVIAEIPQVTFDGWFIAQVVPRQEKRIAFMLENKGYDQYLPLLSEKLRTGKVNCKPLFPGYLFCRFRPEASGLVVSTSGVIRLLGCRNAPATLAAEEMRYICRIVASQVPVESRDLICIGSRIVIESGPLTGVCGRLLEVKKNRRIAVSVDLLCRSIIVALHDWQVRALA